MPSTEVSDVRGMWGKGQFGFGFVIGGIVAVIYATEQEARNARALVVEALVNAIVVSG